MNYVIQNFYKPSSKFSPNINYFLLFECKNLFKLYTFFKLFEIYWKIPLKTFLIYRLWDIFKLSMFDNSFFFFFFSFKSVTPIHQTSKFQKSLKFYALNNLNQLIYSKKPVLFPVVAQKKIFYNAYFFTELVIYFSFKNNIYLPLFIHFLLLLPQQWPICSEIIKLSSMFIRVTTLFKLIYFENKRVFKTQRL